MCQVLTLEPRLVVHWAGACAPSCSWGCLGSKGKCALFLSTFSSWSLVPLTPNVNCPSIFQGSGGKTRLKPWSSSTAILDLVELWFRQPLVGMKLLQFLSLFWGIDKILKEHLAPVNFESGHLFSWSQPCFLVFLGLLACALTRVLWHERRKSWEKKFHWLPSENTHILYFCCWSTFGDGSIGNVCFPSTWVHPLWRSNRLRSNLRGSFPKRRPLSKNSRAIFAML